MSRFIPGHIRSYSLLSPSAFGSDLFAWLDDTTAVQTRETSAVIQFHQRLSVADSSDFDFGAGDFTIALWANPANFNSYRHICSQQNNASQKAFYCDVEKTSGKAYIGVSSNGTSYSFAFSSGALTAGAWNSVIFTRDTANNRIRISINGGVFNDTAFSGANTLFNSNQPLLIGVFNNNGTYINGFSDGLGISSMAQFGIWKGRTFSTSDVSWWHNSGSGRDGADVISAYSTNLVYYNELKNRPWTTYYGGATSAPASNPGINDGKVVRDRTAINLDYVYSWANKAPASGTFIGSEKSQRPSLNTVSHQCVVLSGTYSQDNATYMVSSSAVSLGTSFTVLAAMKAHSLTTGDLCGSATGTNYFKFGMNSSGELTSSIYNTSNAATNATQSVSTALTTGSVVHMRVNSGTAFLGQNGTEGAGNATGGTPRTGSINLYLGAASASGSHIRADIYEYVFVNRNLTSSELSGVVRYLRNRWSI